MTSALRSSCVAALLVAASGLPVYAASTVNVYLSAPFTETAGSSGLPTSDGTATGTPDANNMPNTLGFAGTSTETFEEATGTYKTLTSSTLPATTTFTTAGTGFTINANGQYGAGGQNNYLGVPSGTGSITITMGSSVGYFGLMWCAVDAGNSLTLYDQNNAVIGTFNAATFSQILPTSGTVKAVNGNTYNTANYYGQPTGTTSTANRQNAGEQYAYLNFVAQGATKISKIVESETGATFESDNYSILSTAPTVSPSSNLVFVTTVPEPSTWAMILGTGGLMMLTIGRRHRRG